MALEHNAQSLGVRDALMRIPGIHVRLLDSLTWKVTVQDPGVWNEHLELLIPIVGQLIFDEYADAPFEPDSPIIRSEIIRQLRITFRNAKYAYIIENGEAVIGFSSMQEHREDSRVGIIRDIIVQPQYRGRGYGKKLYERMYTDHDFEALIGSTSSIGPVITRFRVAQAQGYETFFGSMIRGRSELARYPALLAVYLRDEDMLLKDDLDLGYVLVRPEVSTPIEDSVRSPQDPQLLAALEEMVRLQKESREGIVEGILITIRTNASG